MNADQVVGSMKALRIVGALGAGALMLASSGAGAQDEGVAVKSLLGAIGIIPKDRPPIEYRERPPLVVPQRLELPAPVDASSVEARAPNWPRDPDVLARREDDADARAMGGESRVDRRNRKNVTMMGDEMRAGTRAGAGAHSAVPMGDEKNSALTPAELARMDNRRNQKLSATYEEPERRSLTEPPTGYRKAAAGAAVKATVDPEEPDTSTASGFSRWLNSRR
jgi:hypothetical protein